MRLVLSALALLSMATFAFSVTGCKPETGVEVKKDDHDHGHEHAHAPHGPHDGHILELGDEEYHAEWTHDDAGDKVTVYILDEEMKQEVPIAAESITINTQVGDKDKSFTLDAVNAADGKASQFESTDKTLLPILTSVGEDVSATLEVNVGEKAYTAKFEKHEEHDHHHH